MLRRALGCIENKRLVIIMIINLFVAGRGYDPRTSGLWIRRSNQLSYPAVHLAFVLESGCKGMKKISYSQILSRFFNGYSIKSFIFAPDNRNKRLYNMLLFCVITAFLGLQYYWRIYLLVCLKGNKMVLYSLKICPSVWRMKREL